MSPSPLYFSLDRISFGVELYPFIPAKAGIQFCPEEVAAFGQGWVPASAGTNGERASIRIDRCLVALVAQAIETLLHLFHLSLQFVDVVATA